MNIQQFEYVLAVAEYRHFETAADKCFVAQSTLSTMISKLEEELGLVLFNRRRKPVELTSEGERVVRQLRLITSEISGLKEMVKEIKGEVGGVVKISCIPTIAPFLLPLFLRQFSETYPKLIIELSESPTEDILHQLKSREVDIGIVSPPFDSSQLLEIPLYKEPYVLYDMTLTSDVTVSIEEVDLNNFWLLEDGHCMSDQVVNFCSSHRKDINNALNIRFKAGSIGSLVRFVRGNQGRTFLPYLAARQLVKDDNEKHIISFKEPIPKRTVSLLVHDHFPKRSVLNALRQAIINCVGVIDEIEALKQNKSPVTAN